MATPLDSFLRPGFPKQFATNESYEFLFEYVGPISSVFGVAVLGEAWGDVPGIIEDARGEPIEGTDYAILQVRVVKKFSSTEPIGPLQEMETNYELEWVAVQKPLIDHPAFAMGGAYELDKEVRQQIAKWEEMPVIAFKIIYKFYPGRYEDWQGTEDELVELSTNGQYFADGRLLGIEYFNEYVPVIRKTTVYKNGLPSTTGAGMKENPDFGDNDVPTGYEWIKNSDTVVMTGKQNEWQRNQEWIGATKVLVDSKETFW